MDRKRVPKRIWRHDVVEGSRGLGRPQKQWEECVQDLFASAGVEPKDMQELAGDRKAWRTVCLNFRV